MYGTMSHAAGFDIRAKRIIVTRIAIHKNPISISAPPSECMLKKIIDQRVLSTSCRINTPSAIFTARFSSPLFHTKYAAIPIKRNSVVHTGPNTHDGGLKLGFAIVVYQPFTSVVVKIEPMIHASCETTIAMVSLSLLFMCKCILPPLLLYGTRISSH